MTGIALVYVHMVAATAFLGGILLLVHGVAVDASERGVEMRVGHGWNFVRVHRCPLRIGEDGAIRSLLGEAFQPFTVAPGILASDFIYRCRL